VTNKKGHKVITYGPLIDEAGLKISHGEDAGGIGSAKRRATCSFRIEPSYTRYCLIALERSSDQAKTAVQPSCGSSY
jgi:hypothetical protein